MTNSAKKRRTQPPRRVPEHVSAHGESVMVPAEGFPRLKDDRMGDALIAALQASPYREIDLEPKRVRMPVRNIEI